MRRLKARAPKASGSLKALRCLRLDLEFIQVSRDRICSIEDINPLEFILERASILVFGDYLRPECGELVQWGAIGEKAAQLVEERSTVDAVILLKPMRASGVHA